MSRDQLIRLLVVDTLEHADNIGRYRWLARILESGFCGFASMNDKELADEAKLRGIDTIDADISSHGDSDDTDENDDMELSLLIASFSETRDDLDFA